MACVLWIDQFDRHSFLEIHVTSQGLISGEPKGKIKETIKHLGNNS